MRARKNEPLRGESALPTLDRRGFLAAAGLAGLSLGLSGCDSTLEESDGPASADADIEPGEWKPVACWHNCAGLCLNKGLVKDGVVVRMKSDDTHEDTLYSPQSRGCAKGRAQRQNVYSADRIKYPMKRKHWEPNAGGDNSLRGKDDWERISWDEALDYVAGEIQRVRESYGYESVLVLGGDDLFRGMAFTGGFMGETGTTSPGHNMADFAVGHNLTLLSDRSDLMNTDYVFMFGNNCAWNAVSEAMVAYQAAKDNGTQYFGIDPFYNDTYAALDAKWIPIRPGTDTAFLAAMAYVMITEDDPKSNPLIDWDFLERCTIGFTADSIPESEKGDESYYDYVMGTVDDVPKTPEWAAEQCDCDPEHIRMLARLNGKNNAVAYHNGLANGRNMGGENAQQAFLSLASMGGHFGKPGHGYSNNVVGNSSAGYGSCLWTNGSKGLPNVVNPYADSLVLNVHLWESIEKGSYQRAVYCNRGAYLTAITQDERPDEEKLFEIREMNTKILYWGGMDGWGFGNEMGSLQQKPDIARAVKVLRSEQIDSVFCNAFNFHPGAQWADVVLPVATPWEKPGYEWRCGGGPQTSVVVWDQVIDPLYEAKSDQDIVRALVDRLGFDSNELYPFSERQQFFNELVGSTVAVDNGAGPEFIPLVSVTQEEISAWGVEGTPQEGAISLTELFEKGVYAIPRSKDDSFTTIAYEAFAADPESNPIANTASGKFELYCRELKRGFINRTGFGTYQPIARYVPGSKNYPATFTDFKTKTKGEYPFTLSNVHYKRSCHSTLDNVGCLQEAFPAPVYINAKDAEEYGIGQGDQVLITTEWGQGLRPACITQRVMPGHLILPQNRWFDYDEETGIDKAGSANFLLGPVATGFGVFIPNSEICRIEKYNGPLELPDDHMRELKTPGL